MSSPLSPRDGSGEFVATIDWRGVTVAIRYEADWLNMCRHGSRYYTAHLEIEAIGPARAPLPITETGYRSHFTSPAVIAEAGGPVAYALAWLNSEARTPAWRAEERQSRQLNLF